MGLLAFGDLVRIAQDDGEAARRGGKLNGLEQLSEKRIGNVRNDQAQQPAGTLAQAPRGSIGGIAELVDRSGLTLAGLLRTLETVATDTFAR